MAGPVVLTLSARPKLICRFFGQLATRDRAQECYTGIMAGRKKPFPSTAAHIDRRLTQVPRDARIRIQMGGMVNFSTLSQVVNITYQSNGTNDLFYMNNSTFRADYDDAILLDAKLGKTSFPSESNVYDFGQATSIRLVVYNYAQTGAHPMHLHGHNSYILSVGTGMCGTALS